MIRTIIPYVLSIFTLTTMYLAGEKKRSGWLLGVLNQGLWLFWIIITGTYGLLLLTIALTIIYSRNYILWKQ